MDVDELVAELRGYVAACNGTGNRGTKLAERCEKAADALEALARENDRLKAESSGHRERGLLILADKAHWEHRARVAETHITKMAPVVEAAKHAARDLARLGVISAPIYEALATLEAANV